MINKEGTSSPVEYRQNGLKTTNIIEYNHPYTQLSYIELTSLPYYSIQKVILS